MTARYHSPAFSPRERRKNPRINAKCELTARFENRIFSVISGDISFTGAYLECNKSIAVGAFIELDLASKHCRGSTGARIVHRTGKGFGVLFLKPSHAFLDALYEVIFNHIDQNANSEEDYGRVPGRIMINVQTETGYSGLPTCAIGSQDLWVLTDQANTFTHSFWITLSEHGVFDCRVQVEWRSDVAMGLKLIEPTTEFVNAYQRLRAALMG